ncbi:hypothetical protein Tco_1327222 [Tanacetum coccineum]
MESASTSNFKERELQTDATARKTRRQLPLLLTWGIRTQFKEFLASKGVNATDLLNQGWQQDFEDFTRCEPSAYKRELLENLDTLEAVIHRVVNTYGVLRMKENELNALKENGSQLHDEILHEHQIKSSVKMQSQDIQINPVQAMDDSLIVSKGSLIEPENNNAFSKSEIETQMQRQEENVNMREAVDAGLVVTESSGSYTTQAVDADIGPVHDDEPFAEVQLTALHNILANEQQHTEQSEPSYDTHLLETIDSNTTPTSTNMCHRGGEIDQDALLKTELLKTKDMVDKEIYNELSKRFLQLEKHCISLEIQIQQKEESFQSNKPCKNQEFPEFREFFVINDLKAQLLARTTLICNLKKQIKSVKETSNEAKVKNNIDVIETINIELEHSVAKLLAANEQLHKENEHLKQTYKELYDSIKKTRIQNKDNSESLISQINQKSVENADLKAQIQEKVFANAALNNELRKLKGNIVDSKFTKASILGKPPLQPSRNHLVVRQPNAFTSERPRISRPRFASQVDEKNDLSKTVTPHYLPKVRESAAAKPHQVNAPNYSRNSHKESYGSNDMVHAYFLEDARKMTQDKTRIPNHRDMASTRAHCTPNACTPKPRNIYRSSPVSKCSGGMSNGDLRDNSCMTTFIPKTDLALELAMRWARLEQEMSEVKKTDHSADVLASIKSQVPTVVDKYLGTKLDDALLKILERHTADLIEKYSALPGPDFIEGRCHGKEVAVKVSKEKRTRICRFWSDLPPAKDDLQSSIETRESDATAHSNSSFYSTGMADHCTRVMLLTTDANRRAIRKARNEQRQLELEAQMKDLRTYWGSDVATVILEPQSDGNGSKPGVLMRKS